MTDIHDLAAPYALDALDADEAREFAAHLEACSRCQAEVVELREGAADVAGSVAVTPPPEIKTAVMDAIVDSPSGVARLDKRRPQPWLVAVTAAAALMALVFAGLWMASSNRLAEAELIASVYEAPDATFLDFETSRGSARFVFSPALDRGVFNGDRLVELDEADIYQLWLIDSEGPMSAGTLEPGDTQIVVEEIPQGATLAMTVEMAPGADSPTGEPLFASEL